MHRTLANQNGMLFEISCFPYFLPNSFPFRASHRPHLWSVIPLNFELPLVNPVLQNNQCRLHLRKLITKLQLSTHNQETQVITSCIPSHLLKIMFIITNIKVDISINNAKLDSCSIICPESIMLLVTSTSQQQEHARKTNP
ncbi:hypothetical protein Dimus_022599 [Dionaea muscipula]